MKVGDRVYLMPTGNNARYYKDDIMKSIRES